MQIECDACGAIYEPEVKDVPAPGGVVRQFECTNCRQVYPVCFITDYGKQLERRLHVLRAAKNQDRTKFNWLLDRYQREVTEVTSG